MRSWRQSWVIGLAPLALFWAAASEFTVGDVEQDLRGKVASVAVGGIDGLHSTVRGRDVRLAGAAFTPEFAASAPAAILAEPGVRRVVSDLSVIPEAKPYAWSATRDGARVTLSGSVPDPPHRSAALKAAKALPGVEVVDQLGYARGQSADFESATAFSLAELGRLSSGGVTLSDGALAITGVAASSPAYELAMGALRALPKGLTAGKIDIHPPRVSPYVLAVTRGPQLVAMEGSAPSFEEREALLAAAAAAFPGVRIAGRIAIASGEPSSGFDAAAKAGIAALARLEMGTATLTDANLRVSGQAREVGGLEALRTGLAALPAGFSLAGMNVAAATASPYVFSVSAKGGGVVLSGDVPSEAARAALLAAARSSFPAATVDDRLLLAQGADAEAFGKEGALAIVTAASLSQGEASLTDGVLAASGKARDFDQADGLRAGLSSAVAAIGGAAKLGALNIAPPDVSPFVFSLTKSAAGLEMSGYAPDAATRTAIEAAAKGSGLEVLDKTRVAAGAPAGVDFLGVAQFTLDGLAGLTSGEAKLSDAELSITGVATGAPFAEALRQALAAPPAGVTIGTVAIETPPTALSLDDVPAMAKADAEGKPALDAAGCDAGFKGLLESSTIEFESGLATISNKSAQLLVGLAANALRCDVQSIEVSGHTDNQGDAALNAKLSRERAGAVGLVLRKAGVPDERVTEIGLSAERPVASNDTEEGRARNRRIEFSVK